MARSLGTSPPEAKRTAFQAIGRGVSGGENPVDVAVETACGYDDMGMRTNRG
jgi:hypothetical protein